MHIGLKKDQEIIDTMNVNNATFSNIKKMITSAN